MITRDKNIVLDRDVVNGCLEQFNEDSARLERLHNYYAGETLITKRIRDAGLPNNRLMHAFPRYIVTMTSGYLLGEPVQYTADEEQEAAMDALQSAYNAADVGSVDAEVATAQAIYGRGIELVYADSEARPRTTALDPRNAFVVYADDAEGNPLFGVHRLMAKDKVKRFYVYTPSEVIEYSSVDGKLGREEARKAHNFPYVPIVEYWNNNAQTGDYEHVMSLIDAYDVLQSDRVNDKEQFADALLVLTGVAGFAPSDNPDDKRTAAQRLKEEGTLALPDVGAKAEYLIKSMSEADTEILKTAIREDIHKFSHVPDLADEQFAGNSSGVAMRFKLLGLGQLTKIKERWFREGLRWRLRLFAGFLALKGAPALDADKVQMQFRRALPVNDVEIAQMVSMLSGIVPAKSLLSQIPFVNDVNAAYDELAEEKQQAIANQAAAFGAMAIPEEVD